MNQPTRTQIINDLRDGYGVEDISLLRNYPEVSIRAVVRHMRDLGALPKFYHAARALWRMEYEMKGRSE